MPKVRSSIEIAAPVARVFDYVADPKHLLEIWPNMVEITNITPHADGGTGFDWVYRMAGIKVRGHSEDVEFVRNECVVSRSEAGIPNTFRWLYDGAGDATMLTLEVDYDAPTSVFGRLARPILDRINRRDARTLLRNLKTRMERPAAGGTVQA